MNKPELLRKLNNINQGRWQDFSFLSEQIVRDLIDTAESFQDLYDQYPYECESNLTYYSQAWNYLMDENVNDFKEAIESGAETITEIAYYYLTEEVSEILSLLENK